MKHYDGQRWNYRGFIIWCFDGAYDIHASVDAHPIAEGIPTAEEARAIINDERWFKAFESGNIKMKQKQ